MVGELIVVSLATLTAAAGVLGAFELIRYRRTHRRAHLYWSIGLWMATVSVAQEAVFAAGLWSSVLMASYLVLVAILVPILSLGSLEARGGWSGLRAYRIYLAGAAASLFVAAALAPVSSSILQDGIVTGNPPDGILVGSILLTVPSSILVAYLALLGALKGGRRRLLFIAAGVVVISFAGVLYIVSIPVTLYYAEFIGFVLLFLGFGTPLGVSSPRSSPTPSSGSG